MSTVTAKELLSKFRSGDVATSSTLNLRDEDLQKKDTRVKIGKLKKAQKKKSKLLFVRDLAIDWNPLTGERDAQFNKTHKFRPDTSVTSTILALKANMNENEKAKEVFMTKANVTEWDTSDIEIVTDTDKIIFGRYLFPRVFTLPVISVNLPSFTGNAWGKKYLTKVERDPETRQIVGETPILLKFSKFLNDMCYEERQELEAKISSGDIQVTDEDKKELVRKINAKRVISDIYPDNYALAYEIKQDSKFKIADSADIASKEPNEVIENLRLVPRNAEVEKALERYRTGENENIDYYMDVFEYDMVCGNDTDPKKIGADTRYNGSQLPLKNLPECEQVLKSIRGFLDETEDIEKIFMNSAYIYPFDESLTQQLADCIRAQFPIEGNPYLTNKVIKANAEVITTIYGSAGADLIAQAAIGLGTEGNLDEVKSSKEAEKISIEQALGGEEDDSLEIEDGDGPF